MDASHPVDAKQFRTERSRFEQTVLLLQGSGALGSYQAGVYQALAEANLHPDWVAGISIGAVNAIDRRQSTGGACREIAGLLGSCQHAAFGYPISQVDRHQWLCHSSC